MMISASKMRLWLRLAVMFGSVALMAPRAGAQGGGDAVFRIVVQQDTREDDARSFKLHLEGLGYVPIVLGDFKNGLATVYYGNFPNAREAERAKKELTRNGISAIQIVQMARSAEAEPGKAYTILVLETKEPVVAAKLRDKLESEGGIDIKVYKNGDLFRVGSGNYNSNSVAMNVLATVRNNGYAAAKIMEVAQMGRPTEVSSDPAKPAATPAPAAESLNINAAIAAAGGKELTPEQLAQVKKLLEESEQAKKEKSSTGNAEFEARMKKIEEQMGGFGVKLEKLANEVETEKIRLAAEGEKVSKVAGLLRDADVMARSKKWEEAIALAKQGLELDPNNNYATQRIHAWELLKEGKGPIEGDEEAQRLRDQAAELEKLNTEIDLTQALSIWRTVKVKFPSFEGEADAKIKSLSSRIEQVKAQSAPKPQNQLLPWILTGSLGFLVAMIAVVFYMRSRKQHREMLARIQEATAMRPMRGLYGGPGEGNQLPSGGQGGELPMPAGWPQAPQGGGMTGGAAPQMTPPPPASPQGMFDAGEAFDFDPLGPPPPRQAPPPPPPPPPAPAPQPRMAATISESELNDLFGGPSEAPPPPRPAPRPAPQVNPEESVNFGDVNSLFEPTEEEKPKPATKAVAAPVIDDSPALSLDDLLGGPGETTRQMNAPPAAAVMPVAAAAPAPAPPPALDPFDLLNLGGGAPQPVKQSTPLPVNSFAGTPFDDILGGAPTPPPASATPVPSSAQTQTGVSENFGYGGDETLIEKTPPAAAIQRAAGMSISATPGVSIPELKALNLSGLKAVDETISGFDGGQASIPGGGIVFTQNFEQDELGRQPSNWQGSFSFADLTVRNDTPPAGNRNYLVYKKDEGIGKVYYSAKFPNTGGVLSVEFDLRCNDKNKFLLGFYIEKDEDFQQSIHTKILRSESQTAPSIHVHGQPAPYLLGTWAHIRYVINLIEGKVDGYVDDRHVAKGVTLPQVPKYMNTLAIRDNINTTGSLFIDNILIRKIE